jgi:hypothetical protein
MGSGPVRDIASTYLATMSATDPERSHPMKEEEEKRADEQEGDAPGSADTLPAAPEDDDDSAAGDTDQHSSEPA